MWFVKASWRFGVARVRARGHDWCMVDFLTTDYGAKLAYVRTLARGPGVVFLHGLQSEMNGTKAMYLQDWAQKAGRSFLRFDCRGHGQSSGAFRQGCIGDWLRDSLTMIETLTEGPQILVGSSMGGWLMLLLAKAVPRRLKGLVGIAAAPDFTEEMWAAMSVFERGRLRREGIGLVPDSDASGYFEVWKRFIEDGHEQCVLDKPLRLLFPVRLLHGMDDAEVPVATALRLVQHAHCADMRLTLVKGAGHRFSEPAQLAMMVAAVEDLS